MKLSRLNIQPEQCKFYVNKEERIIACVYTCAPTTLLDFLQSDDDSYDVSDYTALRLKGKYSAVARCSAEDEWDEQTGRDLAFMRLKQKYLHNVFRCAQNWINHKDEWLCAKMEKMNKFGALGQKDIDRYIEKLDNVIKKE